LGINSFYFEATSVPAQTQDRIVISTKINYDIIITSRMFKMRKLFYSLTIFMFLLAVMSYAQDQKSSDGASKFKISFSERFRIETWDNALTLSSAANAGTTYNRNRSSLMGQWFPNENIEFALMLTNEFKYYFSPTNKNFNYHEIFFDQLYFKYSDTFGSVTLGRQNIMLGEGFIVLEGNPLDGSRSLYFNAARLDLAISKSKVLTGFVSYVPKSDNILPVISSQDQQLIEQSELGAGLYFTGQFEKINLQPYYIYKHIYTTDLHPISSNIHTIGIRESSPIAEQFTLTAEGAYQFGDYGDQNRSAVGGYAYVDYATKLNKNYLPEVLTLGGIYLSGDDPATKNMEGWDPVFSRWPKWSESYIYTLIKENNGKVAYWTNLASIYGKVKFTLMNDLYLNIDYHHLFGLKNNPALSFPGGAGNTRGDFIIGKLTFKINNNISGHLLWENFTPGNFYFDGANRSNWARVEFMFKI
jgi:hypothetical protein